MREFGQFLRRQDSIEATQTVEPFRGDAQKYLETNPMVPFTAEFRVLKGTNGMQQVSADVTLPGGNSSAPVVGRVVTDQDRHLLYEKALHASHPKLAPIQLSGVAVTPVVDDNKTRMVLRFQGHGREWTSAREVDGFHSNGELDPLFTQALVEGFQYGAAVQDQQ